MEIYFSYIYVLGKFLLKKENLPHSAPDQLKRTHNISHCAANTKACTESILNSIIEKHTTPTNEF